MGTVALILQDGPAAGCEVRQGRQHLRKLAAHLIAQGRDDPRVQPSDVLVERVDENPERQVTLQLGGAAAEDRASTPVGALGQLGQQAGLADPGLALDHERSGPTVAQLAEGTIDRFQFGGAPNEVVRDLGHESGSCPPEHNPGHQIRVRDRGNRPMRWRGAGVNVVACLAS